MSVKPATPANDALLDAKAIEHLDFAPTCEAQTQVLLTILSLRIRLGRNRGCEKPVVGVVTCRWCGTSWTVCQKHAHMATGRVAVECTRCGTHGASLAVFHFTGATS